MTPTPQETFVTKPSVLYESSMCGIPDPFTESHHADKTYLCHETLPYRYTEPESTSASSGEPLSSTDGCLHSPYKGDVVTTLVGVAYGGIFSDRAHERAAPDTNCPSGSGLAR